MTIEFMLISHNLFPSCQIHGERRQIPSGGMAVADSVVLVDWRRRGSIRWKIIAVELGGIGMEWSMMRMSCGGGMRGRENMIHRRGREAGVGVLKERGGTMTQEMIVETETIAETGVVGEIEEEGIETDMMIEETEGADKTEEGEIGTGTMIVIEIEDIDS
jgi:hypothetical protein